ncbi:hypothetical protein BC827DRAFT_1158946 [Russula dissimulans]|nr:hypothetical protein BC827DRAFT_1158946 [Russula dissimulans]
MRRVEISCRVLWQTLLNISQCDSSLSSWRSEIGKAGYQAIIDLWDSDPQEFGNTESRREYVAYAINQAHFVYRDPEALVVAKREVFCSDLLSKVDTLNKIGGLKDYEDQVGALALATITVEHGLMLFSTGVDALKMSKRDDSQSTFHRNASA